MNRPTRTKMARREFFTHPVSVIPEPDYYIKFEAGYYNWYESKIAIEDREIVKINQRDYHHDEMNRSGSLEWEQSQELSDEWIEDYEWAVD